MDDEPTFEVVASDVPLERVRGTPSVRASGKTLFRDRPGRMTFSARAPGDEPVPELIYREDVWDRDKGVCQICMTPIPERVGRRGRLSFVIDHVDPAGDHVMSNVRAAHAFCNGSKWIRDSDPEVLLAQALLSFALANWPAKKASLRIEEELTTVHVDRPHWWRLAARRAWSATGGRRPAEPDERIANVRYWADRLSQEVERYLPFVDETREGSAI